MLSSNLKRLRQEIGMSLEDLAQAVGTSRQNIHRYEKGQIGSVSVEMVELLAKALGVEPSELLGWDGDTASPVKRLPLLGSISCGIPKFADPDGERLYDGAVDADFCLIARGDSMVGARIYDGDTVFIKSQSSVSDGEIAAVVIDDEATLKRVHYYPDQNRLVLSPENPKYQPLTYTDGELNEIRIIGKAVAFRSRLL